MTLSLDIPTFKRALDYPYDVPEAGFQLTFPADPTLFVTEQRDLTIHPCKATAVGLDGNAVHFYDFTLEINGHETVWPNRAAFLASGSNAAPAQLKRKFTDRCSGALLTFPLWVQDHIPVFSAHFSHYGSITATLLAYQGFRARLFVNLLDPQQVQIMHQTEGNYTVQSLPSGLTQNDDGETSPEFWLHYYESQSGPLSVAGRGPSLCGPFQVEPEGLQRHSEQDLLEKARRTFCPEKDLEAFIALLLADPQARRDFERHLRREGLS